MNRFILLNPSDIHRPGDEIWCLHSDQWVPVQRMHHGDRVGESHPCRRRLTGAMLAKWAQGYQAAPKLCNLDS